VIGREWSGTGIARPINITGGSSVVGFGSLANAGVDWTFSAGHLLTGTDNTKDIGASGATRPRTGYFGTSVITPTITISTPDTNTQAITVLGQSGGQAAKLQSWGWASSPNETYIDGSGNLFARSVATNSTINVGSFSFGSLTAESGSGTGIYGDNTSQEIRFKTGTAVKWKISNAGYLLANTDNIYDIGASGATRPRNLYVGSSVLANGGYFTLRDAPIHFSNSNSDPASGAQLLLRASPNVANSLCIGGITSSFPAIKRNGAGLDIRLADDSTYANLGANAIILDDAFAIKGAAPSGWIEIGSKANVLTPNTSKIAFWESLLGLVQLANNGSFSWSSLSYAANGNGDLALFRDATGTLAQRNGLNAQTFRLYNTYTDATAFERLNLKWDTNVLKIGTEKGSVGGAARDLVLETDATERLRVLSTGNVGIGTNAPSYLLDVKKSGGTGVIIGSFGDTSNNSRISFKPYNTSIEAFVQGVFGTTLQLGGGGFSVIDSGNTGNTLFSFDGVGLHVKTITSSSIAGATYNQLKLTSNWFPSGDTTNPAINFTVYNSLGSSDQLSKIQIFNGDNGKVLLNPSAGNVGIGTTTPSTLLHLRGGVSPTIKIEGYDAGAVYVLPSISFHSNNSQGNYESAKIEGSAYRPAGFNSLNFFISDSAGVLRRMWQLDSSGNLVQNPGDQGGNYTNTGIQFSTTGTNGTGSRFIQINETASTGHPGEMLKLKAGDANSAATGGLNFGGKIFVYGGKAVAANTSPKDGDVILAHDGTTAIGNVGIGTAAPFAKLDIAETWNNNSVAITGASGTGTIATITFATQTAVIPVGSTIVVTGINPSGYNGTFIVTASSLTSVSYANTTTAAWVSGGTVQQLFTAVKLNVTDTASNVGSNLLDFQVGGVSKAKVTKYGSYIGGASGASNSPALAFPLSGSYAVGVYSPSSYKIQFAMSGVSSLNDTTAYSGLQYEMTGCTLSWGLVAQDIVLSREGAGILAQRNLANAQTFRLYNTYTDATTFERLNLKWDTNVLKIGTEKGSVGGAARAMEFQTDGTTRMTVTSTGDVGIGTNAPGARLNVQSPLTSTIGSTDSSVMLGQAGTSNIYCAFRLDLNGSFNIDSKLGSWNATPSLTILRTGNIGIGIALPTEKLDVVGNAKVSGHFSAATKSFLIPHPTKAAKQLQYACLEGPENGVYIRGKTNESIILLPEYWRELVDEDSVTVTLTQIGKPQQLFVASQNSESVEVGNVDGFYNYVIFGERKDVDKLQTEI
jgi:hypothetical protein